jgi:hypothetical protein
VAAPVRGSRQSAAVKPRHHRTALDACKTEQIRATLCLHRVSPGLETNVGATRFSHIQTPYALTRLRNPG